jgi:hypothetical protein
MERPAERGDAMNADNVTPIRPKAAKPPRRRKPKVENTFDMPDHLRLIQALHGVCEAAETHSAESRPDPDVMVGLCTASEILSRMLWESLVNTGVV